MRPAGRTLFLTGLVLALVTVPTALAWAHPLGNFTTNVYAGLRVGPQELLIDYVMDLAEIPALQARQEIDADQDGRLAPHELARYREARCSGLAAGLEVAIGGSPVTVRPTSAGLTFPPGQAGLPTLRLECTLTADFAAPATEFRLAFSDGNFPDRIGWREVTASGEGVTLLSSSVPAASLSQRLVRYPEDRLQSPLNVREAILAIGLGGGPPAGEPTAPELLASERLAGPTERLSSLVSVGELTAPLVLAALGIAVALGALHGLAPGHGKTVMAAYIVGRRGGSRHALLIGLTVAGTHTVGVGILGALIASSRLVGSERLYPWLGMVSGLLIAAMGVGLLRRGFQRLRGEPRFHHNHASADWPGLMGMGLAGGLVPSPSALLLLLGAVALDRAWFGIVLVAAYGLGMALTLLVVGLLFVGAHHHLEGWLLRWPIGRWAAHLPVATACLVLGGGLFLAARAAAGI